MTHTEKVLAKLDSHIAQLGCHQSARVGGRLIIESRGEIKRLLEALKKIRDMDYRGNRSTEQQIAYEALKDEDSPQSAESAPC